MERKKFIAALDAGTTSTRCILFDHDGNVGLSDKMCVCYRRVAGLDVAFLDAD